MRVVWYLLFYPLVVIANEQAFIDTMSQYVPVTQSIKKTLSIMASPTKNSWRNNKTMVSRPLYCSYPQLSQELPHSMLAELPTPITRLAGLENHFNTTCTIFFKDDGLTGMHDKEKRLFGGNKVRKLEFLLADAVAQGAQSVMTYGCIGSNHVVATGVYAKQLGLGCIAMLTPQEVTEVVKRNLLFMGENDIQMILNPNRELRSIQTICSFVQNKYTYGHMPYFIPTGGSCPLGIVGFVNAAFELKQQIEEGAMPEPDYIYVAMGSYGTLVGLTLGVRAAGLKTKVIGVAVEPDNGATPFLQHAVTLLESTNQLLHEKDNSFPLYTWQKNDILLLHGFGGPDYGVVTPQALEAIESIKKIENVQLDTTYTGKACAGMFDAIQKGSHEGDVVLFWNTFCATSLEPSITFTKLSPAFQQFFAGNRR